jgi:D-3-phosphoglycerate dehydrogenase
VETPATGYDRLNGTGLLEASRVRVTTVGGLFAFSVAEHAWALLCALVRRLPAFWLAQQERSCNPQPVLELQARTFGIVGYGNIGRALARIAKAFGMRVMATRFARPGGEEWVDEFFPRSYLHRLLGAADAAVLRVRGDPENDRLIGARELAAMRAGSWGINVARGSVVDEEALVAALRSGKLAGAGLDVFRDEPLPNEHPLWTLPNVIITPHVAIHLADRMAHCTEHFCENLRRYCTGEPLHDKVPLSQRRRNSPNGAPESAG